MEKLQEALIELGAVYDLSKISKSGLIYLINRKIFFYNKIIEKTIKEMDKLTKQEEKIIKQIEEQEENISSEIGTYNKLELLDKLNNILLTTEYQKKVKEQILDGIFEKIKKLNLQLEEINKND